MRATIGPADSRLRLWSYVYALTRLLEIEAAWLTSVSANAAKIALGRKIGLVGMALEQLHRRAGELSHPDETMSAPVGFEEILAAACTIDGESEQIRCCASLALGLTADMREASQARTDMAYAILDEPTVIALDAAIELLERGVRTLDLARVPCPRPWPDAAAAEARRNYGGDEALPRIPELPARESGLRKGEPPAGGLNRLVETVEGRKHSLFHMFIDIEIAAAEVCARDIVDFRHMPMQFRLDMARQIWDEARHAVAALARYRELGGTGAGESYTGAVWRRWSLGATIEQKLAIQQVVQEGNALDATDELVEAFRGVGDEQTARIFIFLMEDEVLHSRFGNAWLRYLSGYDETSYRRHVEEAAALIGTTVPRAARPNLEMRLRAGFAPEFLDEIAADRRNAQTEQP